MMIAEALLLLVLVGQPSGDDEAQQKAEAGKHLERGNAALKEGDPSAALEAYRAAYDAYPSPKIFFNMAEAHRELGELVEAAELYERVVEELPSNSPVVATARERLTALDERLGRVTVTTEPTGAKIEVAGKDLGISPVSEVRVLPGSVEVRATLNARTESKIVEVDAGGTREVEIQLVDLSAPPPPPPSLVSEEVEVGAGEEEESIASKWWFWTLIGVGVVAAGSTAVVLATSGDDFQPTGELGFHRLKDWPKR